MDLLQAEAVADLVDASTSLQRSVALAQLDGGLARLIEQLRHALLDVQALLVYDLDFPEEDDGPIAPVRVRAAAAAVAARIDSLLSTTTLGEIARDGALVVIAGAPNAGKSSLFNALIGERRAIVTSIPGTTRDAIEARLDGRRWPLRLVDTAGLRSSNDLIERLGMEVSEQHIRGAHLVLLCTDQPHVPAALEQSVRELTSAPVIRVHTKCDLVCHTVPEGGVQVSAVTRDGLEMLSDVMNDTLTRSLGAIPTDGGVLVRARHRAALQSAREEVQLFLDAWDHGSLPAAVAAVHVQAAVTVLEELMGTMDVNEVLDRVFRTFCVGK
jgi:tRNA modification GTPase